MTFAHPTPPAPSRSLGTPVKVGAVADRVVQRLDLIQRGVDYRETLTGADKALLGDMLDALSGDLERGS